GRPEHAELDRSLGFISEFVLDGKIIDRGQHLVAVQSERRGHVGRHVGARNITVFDEEGPIEGLSKLACERRITLVQPIERTRRRLACDWKFRGLPDGDAVKTRRARNIALCVITFQWQVRQRLRAGDLEYHAEQDRFPPDATAIFRGELVYFCGRDVAVWRRVIKVEIYRIGHFTLKV